MKRQLSLLAVSLMMCAAVPSSFAETNEIPLVAKLEVASASAKNAAIAMSAWKNRDPDLFMSIVPSDFRLERADGTVLTWQNLYDRQKMQMAALKHTDRFVLTIEVQSVSADSAIVLSTQDWTRVVVSSTEGEVRYRTGVTHRETWRRVGGQWKMDGFIEENQKREKLDDAAIADSKEYYEIQVKLTDTRDV